MSTATAKRMIRTLKMSTRKLISKFSRMQEAKEPKGSLDRRALAAELYLRRSLDHDGLDNDSRRMIADMYEVE